MFKLLVTILCVASIRSETKITYPCNKESSLLLHTRSISDFSTRFLDRVGFQSQYHFIYSPISTWMQLVDLAEGASVDTFKDIQKATKHMSLACYRSKLREAIADINELLKPYSRRFRYIIVNKFYEVNDFYVKEISKDPSVTVLRLDFHELQENSTLSKLIDPVVDNFTLKIPDIYFTSYNNVNNMFMIEVSYFSSLWKYVFNPTQTHVERFYAEDTADIGEVNMMHQIGSFNLLTILKLRFTALELPLESDDISMLIFLPIEGETVNNLFYNLKDTTIKSVFNLFNQEKKKLVHVALPRFDITSEIINIPELLEDMEVRKVFDYHTAQLEMISNYTLFPSFMSQVSRIEVTEKGVEVTTLEPIVDPKDVVHFIANRPFGFMIVEKTAGIILFSGTYSNPSLY